MKIKTIILFALILTSCDFRSSDFYNSQAELLESEGKYEEAILLLNKAIQKDPKNIHALLNRGVDKSILKDYKVVIEDYSRIVEIDPDNTLAFLNRGKNKKRIQDNLGAIDDFNLAIKTKGGDFLYFDLSDNPYVDNGFEFDVDMAEIKFERGLAYYDIDSLKVAFDDFSFCVNSDYMTPASHYMIGLIYIAYGMTNEGCQALSKSHDLGDPDAQNMIDEYCNK